MNEQEDVTLEVTEQEEEQEVEVEQVDEVETMRAELEKAKQIAENQRIRAEKAEAKAKARPEPTQSSLNAGDMMAIKNADLDPQDMDLVEKFARDNSMSLRDALAHPHAKAILAYEAELRTTAVASNVDGVRRGTIKVTDDTLLHNASANKLPTSDDDIERLIAARMKQK